MKKIIIAMAAIVAAFTMASCNKEPLVEQCILIGEILVFSAVRNGKISEIAQFVALKFLK